MVFCGKPSKGCKTCRERKIRCDQLPDGCSQCTKVHRICPGYRDQLELRFRDESDAVARKAKVKDAKSKAARETNGSSSFSAMSNPTAVSEQDRKNSNDVLVPWRGLPSTFSMAPTMEERSTGFFFSNYVINVNGPTRGYMDHLSDIYNTHDMDENLAASMHAVGLAGYSHTARAPQLMTDARVQYAKALRLTNLALTSPKDAKKDSTLLAIMILSLFENITGCNQRSFRAWEEHINGAAALIKLRGVEQMRTKAGLRMFGQAISNLLTSCIQRRLEVPVDIVELRSEAAKFANVNDAGWRVHDAMIAFTNFRFKTRPEFVTDPETAVSEALGLDRICMNLFSDMDPNWEYRIVYTDADPDIIFDGYYHVYYDIWVAQVWNAVRTMRIFLNEQIREILLAGALSDPPLFSEPEHVTQVKISTDILAKLQADIIASVPQHFGYRSIDTASVPSFSLGSTAESAPSTFSSQARFDESDKFLKSYPRKESDAPLICAVGGYFLLWPLYLAGALDDTTIRARQWVVQSIRRIGHSMGIHQAFVVAVVLERNEEIKAWHKKQAAESMEDSVEDLEVSPA